MLAPSRPTLVIMSITGATPPRTFALAADALTVGRAPTNALALADPAVSREHLRLERQGDAWLATTLPGASPPFVNGRTAASARLQPGDQIVLGTTVLRLTLPEVDGDGRAVRAPTLLANAPLATLHVQCPGGTFDVPLRDAHLTLGRDPASSVVIPSPLVSARHADLLRAPDGRYVLRDLGSTNGLTVGGQRVTEHPLAPGEVVSIGDAFGAQRVVLTLLAPDLAPVKAPTSLPAPRWTGGVATIGRDPASMYCLTNPLISWQHARLSRDPQGAVTLTDLGSTNGTYVNLQRLRAPQALRPNDRVNIGPYAFTFDGRQLVAAPGQMAKGMRLDVFDLHRTARGGQSVLLDHVSLSVLAGEFIAIAGGSGAGKSTLMRALAGIQPAQSGKVFFNGIDAYRHYDVFRGSIGYVPQADIVHGALTVERALFYAARLRLAKDIRPDEIEQRIVAVLQTVKLTHRRQNVIASLSGGERKRVNLAVELLADPPILFLDEPNAGLDPHLRLELIQTMRDLAASGRTIVLVTHHVEDIQACDQLAFMGAGGRLCYFGPPREAPAFFGVPQLEELYAQMTDGPSAEQWRRRFWDAGLYARNVQARLAAPPAAPSAPLASQAARQGWTPESDSVQRLSPVAQLVLLTTRYVEILARDRGNLAIMLLQAPVIGLVLFFVVQPHVFTSAAGTTDAVQTLFLLALIAVWFGASNAAREISKEEDIYLRERLAGLNVAPYIVSKLLVLGALCVFQTLVLLTIVTAKTGLPPASAGVAFPVALELYIGLTLAGLAGLAMGLCVSAFANTPDKAISLVPLILIPQILLAGVIFALNGPMKVVADVTISRWAVEALGTSSDLDRLYYTRLVDSNPTIFLHHPDMVDKAQNTDYTSQFDANPHSANYTPNVDTSVVWNDAQTSRQRQLTITWTALGVLFVGFTALAGVRQRAKDPH